MDFSSFWDIIAIPFGYVMQGFNWLCGGHYVLSLLLFAIAVKLLMLPMSIKQQKTQIKMAKLRPKMALIEKKYAGRNDQVTLRKKQEELMQLQQQEGVSPLSGCLPLLLQFPIIIALYRIIRMPLKYITCLTDETLVKLYNTAYNLTGDKMISSFESIPDQMDLIVKLKNNPALLNGTGVSVDKLPNLNFLGLNLGDKPSFTPDEPKQLWLILIPVLCGVFAYLSMWIARKLNDTGMNSLQAQTPEQKSSMTIMNLMMPLMSVWIAFITSGAVGIYWMYGSLLGILQTVLIAKYMPLPKYTPEEIAQIQKEMKQNKGYNPARSNISSRVDENGKPRSLHTDGDDIDNY